MKLKIPAEAQGRESSGICKTSKEKQRQAGRQRRGLLAEGKGIDGHESRNLTEIQIQKTSQKRTRCSIFLPRVRKKESSKNDVIENYKIKCLMASIAKAGKCSSFWIFLECL